VSRPSLGTLIGPHSGGPMIDAAAQFVGTFGALLERRELLIIDSRGGGRSSPVLCDSLCSVIFGPVTPPARMTSAIGACGRELGPRVGAYGVAAIAITTPTSSPSKATATASKTATSPDRRPKTDPTRDRRAR
jgi:hypothetical protein